MDYRNNQLIFSDIYIKLHDYFLNQGRNKKIEACLSTRKILVSLKSTLTSRDMFFYC